MVGRQVDRRPVTKYRQPIVVKTYATPTSGALIVKLLGAKSGASTGTWVELDGVAARK